MTTKSSEPNAILCMHSVLLTPKGIFQDYEHETFALFSTGVEELYSFPVKVSYDGQLARSCNLL